MGQGIQNVPCKICGKQPLENFTWSILEYLDPNNSHSNTGTIDANHILCFTFIKVEKKHFFSGFDIALP